MELKELNQKLDVLNKALQQGVYTDNIEKTHLQELRPIQVNDKTYINCIYGRKDASPCVAEMVDLLPTLEKLNIYSSLEKKHLMDDLQNENFINDKMEMKLDAMDIKKYNESVEDAKLNVRVDSLNNALPYEFENGVKLSSVEYVNSLATGEKELISTFVKSNDEYKEAMPAPEKENFLKELLTVEGDSYKEGINEMFDKLINSYDVEFINTQMRSYEFEL